MLAGRGLVGSLCDKWDNLFVEAEQSMATGRVVAASMCTRPMSHVRLRTQLTRSTPEHIISSDVWRGARKHQEKPSPPSLDARA